MKEILEPGSFTAIEHPLRRTLVLQQIKQQGKETIDKE